MMEEGMFERVGIAVHFCSRLGWHIGSEHLRQRARRKEGCCTALGELSSQTQEEMSSSLSMVWSKTPSKFVNISLTRWESQEYA